jgi:hypothetical protein
MRLHKRIQVYCIRTLVQRPGRVDRISCWRDLNCAYEPGLLGGPIDDFCRQEVMSFITASKQPASVC